MNQQECCVPAMSVTLEEGSVESESVAIDHYIVRVHRLAIGGEGHEGADHRKKQDMA
jgi:hypothetical protein